jgi:hypothetical protein
VTFSQNPILSICWSIMTVGEFYLAYLCLRSIRGRYPAFTLYINYLALKSLTLMMVANYGDAWAYFYAYYTAGFIAAGLEVSVIIEVFSILFKPYSYIPRRILTILAICVPVALAIVTEVNMLVWNISEHSTLGDYLIAERVATYGVLVLFGGLFCFSSYFAMQWKSRLTGIAIGMFINSLFSVVTTTLMTSMGREATARLAFVPVLSFCACVATWIRYIRRPEELRAVVGPGEMGEIRAMLNEFNLCLARADEGSPTEERKP